MTCQEKIEATILQIHTLYDEEIRKANDDYELLKPKGKYLFMAIDFYYRLNKLIEDLDKVEVFIRIPTRIKSAETKIDNIDYINYHLEVFYHKISTILDVMKLFTNETFELKIKYEKCNWKELKKRSEKTPNMKEVLDVIEKYYESFEGMIQVRNFNTHRAENIDKTSILLSALLLIQENDKLFIPIHLMESEIEKHRREKVKVIVNDKRIIGKYVNCFICSITDEIIERANKKGEVEA